MAERRSVAAVARVRFPLATPPGIELETVRFLFMMTGIPRF